MNVIVTGAAGFIGANLVDELVRSPTIDGVIGIDNLSTGHRENVRDDPGVRFVEADVRDGHAMCEAFAGASAVVHLAAMPSVPLSIKDPFASHDNNATGTLRVLEAARHNGIRHVVVASSSSVYGDTPTLPKHEDMTPTPRSPYAANKLATETYALAHARSFDMNVLAVRFFNVFGPLQNAGHAYAAVVPAFLSAAIDGRPVPLHGDGTQTRDFTYVGSVAAVIRDAIERGVSYDGPVNLAFGGNWSLLRLIDELGHIFGRELEVERLPSRPGDVKDSQADSTRLRGLFPHLDPLPVTDGLRATVGWFEAGTPRPVPHP